ncbi:MAG: DUF1134 domain-containing protein [Sphingomonas sp.]|uniref:DUF1134 domain-containing protein n=1 Tax=Sphingomonas sp. TaxID=28214 RepID=UPI001ACCE963|nr:EipA family protein [Sphingomonas sp.]MBN8816285.1 DUF1134 domain-containing protein [Sphingomonas sp.]
MRRLMTTIALALVALTGPVAAQVTTIDPNAAIDGDLKKPKPAPTLTPAAVDPAPLAADERGAPQDTSPPPYAPPPQDQTATVAPPEVPPTTGPTYDKGDVLAAAEGVFGKGAKGLADIIEKILAKQGRPNAYIAGKEAAGAFVIGARYGSGTLSHAVAGNQKIYWRGPSVGFDVGGDATKVFILVYNLYDTEDAFKAYASGEGRLYFVGGFSATYLRHGNIVMIPVRLGVGWRAGVNAGYVKFRHKGTWVPF